ncbi:hypothetical protein DMC16_15535 [Lacticaseibacillus paracasei]|uniref:hypothetical protein n=1 Tax=Lacticaseibacillus paracasei TaxID=1597 RepID=UPI000D752285|nr:hypothetical protein [Lacticaseibacillus paracasei]AWR92427.1 hypothetical protein DMC16_15535 [Lacticaseibacillus paracasei]
MNNDFEKGVEYLAPGYQPMGQILTPETVIEASEDLMEYRQIINNQLMVRGCDNGAITIHCLDLNGKAIGQLISEIKKAGWQVAAVNKTLYID